MTVSSDQKVIAEAKKLAMATMDSRVRKLMERPEEFKFENLKWVKESALIEIIPAWRAIVKSADEPFERRLVAAEFLSDRRDDVGLSFLIKLLGSDDKEQQWKAIRSFPTTCLYEDWWAWVRTHSPEFSVALLSLMTPANSDMIPTLTDKCKTLEVAGLEAVAIELWDKPITLWARHSLLDDVLSNEFKTLQNLTPIAADLSSGILTDFELSNGLRCASAFLGSSDPNVVQRSIDLIEKYFPWNAEALTNKNSGASSSWLPIFQDVGTRVGRVAVPLLEKFLRSKLNSAYRSYALESLSDALGPDILPYIDESIVDLDFAFSVADICGKVFKSTGDETVIARLTELSKRTSSSYIKSEINRALKAVKAPIKQKSAKKKVDKKVARNDVDTASIVQKASIEQACSQLIGLGLLGPVDAEGIEKIQSSRGINNLDPNWEFLILNYFDLIIAFDTESNDVPPRYDDLIKEFAGSTRKIFSPYSILQTEPAEEGEDVFVQFIFDERLYRFQVQDFGDYYDLERLVSTLNKALGDSGRKERFIAKDNQDQIAEFIFGDPAAIAKVAKKCEWTLDDELNRITVS